MALLVFVFKAATLHSSFFKGFYQYITWFIGLYAKYKPVKRSFKNSPEGRRPSGDIFFEALNLLVYILHIDQ